MLSKGSRPLSKILVFSNFMPCYLIHISTLINKKSKRKHAIMNKKLLGKFFPQSVTFPQLIIEAVTLIVMS